MDMLDWAEGLRQCSEASALARALKEGRVFCGDGSALGELNARGLHRWEPGQLGGSGLLLRGTIPVGRRVAIVGARATDGYGQGLARQIAHDVVSRGFHVVSGGAEGCDRAAHEGALEAGGTTTVVLASGHDHPSPRRHREFFDDIVARQGALVSAYWPTVPPRRHQFLARNQTIAALAECVVVVRARARSGALSTAAHAFRMGKNVLAVPGHVGHELSQGCHHLLARGASALTSHADLMRVLGCDTRGRSWGVFDGREPDLWGNLREPNPPSIEGLNRVDQAIFETLSQEGKLDLDALCVRSGYPGEAVIAALVSLELAGVVHKTVNARYVVVHSAQEKHER